MMRRVIPSGCTGGVAYSSGEGWMYHRVLGFGCGSGGDGWAGMKELVVGEDDERFQFELHDKRAAESELWFETSLSTSYHKPRKRDSGLMTSA